MVVGREPYYLWNAPTTLRPATGMLVNKLTKGTSMSCRPLPLQRPG